MRALLLGIAISIGFATSASARPMIEEREDRVVRKPRTQLAPTFSSATMEPQGSWNAFLGSPADQQKRERLAQMGYVNQSGYNPDVITDEVYGRDPNANGDVETVRVKRDKVTGDVIAIVQTIENQRTGAVITNMIDYEERASSHCTNLQSGKPGAATQCTTVNEKLCARFNDQKTLLEQMPVHYRAMSSQLSQVKLARVGRRIPENNLSSADRARCQNLMAQLDVDRRGPPRDGQSVISDVACKGCGCPGSPPCPPSTEIIAGPEAPREPASPPSAATIWGTK